MFAKNILVELLSLPVLHWESDRHFWAMVPWQPLVGSPVVPAGHLHLNDPTVFSQKAPGPQDEVFALHSSIS